MKFYHTLPFKYYSGMHLFCLSASSSFFATNYKSKHLVFEKVASFGLSSNMTRYLIQDYRMGVTQVQYALLFWGAATSFLPLVRALVSDSYLGRYLTISFGCIFSFLVYSLPTFSLIF